MTRRYSGLLSKKKSITELSGYLKGGLADGAEGWIERNISIKREALHELFRFYGVDPNDSKAWEYLARALAGAHVPAFQIAMPRGRRSKTPAIAKFTAGPALKKRAGAPKKWDADTKRMLRFVYEHGKALLHKEGVTGRITDKAALERGLISIAIHDGMSKPAAQRFARERAKQLTKRLSDSRKSIR